jgi:hypothetical protein
VRFAEADFVTAGEFHCFDGGGFCASDYSFHQPADFDTVDGESCQ